MALSNKDSKSTAGCFIPCPFTIEKPKRKRSSSSDELVSVIAKRQKIDEGFIQSTIIYDGESEEEDN